MNHDQVNAEIEWCSRYWHHDHAAKPVTFEVREVKDAGGVIRDQPRVCDRCLPEVARALFRSTTSGWHIEVIPQ